MPKLHLRTFQKKAYIDGDGTVVFPNAVEIAEGVIPDGGTLTYEANGTDLQTQIDTTNSNVTANATKLTTLLDSGPALDAISELQAAWVNDDGTLQSTIDLLATSASTDRALTRSQFAVSIGELQTDIDNTNALQNTHAGLHVAHTAGLATKATSHQPTFTGNVTINSTSIVGDSGTEIKFNQTNLQLNTHSSGTLSGTAFNSFASGLQPAADQTYDIGSGAKRFREVYTKDLDANQYLVNGVQLGKIHIGLSSVDNTSDANKPVSTAAGVKNVAQDVVIGVNTNKISYTSGASSQVAANKNDIIVNETAIGLNTSKISYSSAASSQVATNKNDIATNITAIGLNTNKVSYSSAASTQVATNKNDIATNITAIGLNTNKVSYSSAASTQVATNASDIATNEAAIALNTSKISYSSAASSQVATNASDIATNEAAIALNTVKISYSSAASTQVAANASDIIVNETAIAENTTKVTYDGAVQVATNVSDIATNEAAIDLNTPKISYTTAASSQVASNVSDISTLLTAINSNGTDISSNAALIANKLNTSGNQTMNGKLTVHYDGGNGVVANPHADDLQVYHYNDGGITIGAPEGKIGTLAFSDQNKADRNQIRAYSTVRDSRSIGMHFLADQLESAVPTLSVVKTLVGINNAQPTYDLDVTGDARVTKNVFFENLPTSDPGVLGQLYVSSGTLKISV